MQLKEVGEFGLIDIIKKQAPASHPHIIKGIGDDAAVVKAERGQVLLVTTDTLNEGVHFRQDYISPFLLGKKCLSVSLSDIAAMGGTPFCYVVSLAVPPATPLSYVKSLYRGMAAQAKRFDAPLAGGDTTTSLGAISVSVTLLGTAGAKHTVFRHGAKPGDLIFVTGTLGDAHLGLLLLKKDTAASKRNPLVKKHCDPVPRIEAGAALARSGIAGSMIDISDGLLADLSHILEKSRVGAEVVTDALPLSPRYRKQCLDFSRDFYRPALAGGEDYELLFTAAPKKRGEVEQLSRSLEVPIACIGKITATASHIVLVDHNGKKTTPSRKGFTHF